MSHVQVFEPKATELQAETSKTSSGTVKKTVLVELAGEIPEKVKALSPAFQTAWKGLPTSDNVSCKAARKIIDASVELAGCATAFFEKQAGSGAAASESKKK